MKIVWEKSIIFFVPFLVVSAFGLENPSFENKDPLCGWQCIAYKQGQEPSIIADANNYKEGRQSVSIYSKDPADIALVQKISLPPDSLWRVTCWVRTENLQATDPTLIGGTLHIRTMDNLPVAEAPGQFGTSLWRKIEVLFRIPSSGEAQIVLFFVGFGKGTGKVWLDDVRLEKIADAPAQVPISGPNAPKVKLFDEIMLKYREKIGCSAAALAISKDGRLLYRRGYGWQDREKTIPADADIMISVASCGKPMIAAGIHQLAQKKVLDLNSTLFDVLPIKPHGKIADERVKKITINDLIMHKAGWGHEPRDKVREAIYNAGYKEPISTETFLSFIVTLPLEDEPGTKGKYCNFAYDVLIVILEEKSKKELVEYFCSELLGMSKIRGMHYVGHDDLKDNAPVVWNDAGGGVVCASAKILCRYMERYWLPGEPRKRGNPYWVFYGSAGNSTAMTVWRSDGINLAALFNGRSSGVGGDEIRSELERAINTIQGNIAANIDFKNNWRQEGILYCSKNVGDTAEYTFEGRRVSWIGRRYDDAGKAKVEIDDKEVAIVDQYGPFRDKPFRWEYENLNFGQHKIVITVLGEKNLKSKDNWINIQKVSPE